MHRFPRSQFICVLLAAVVFGPVAASHSLAQPKAKKPEFDALAAAIVLEQTLVKVIAKAEKSVVSIARIKRNRVRKPQLPNVNGNGVRDRDNPASPDFIPNDFGSGVIISPAGKERFILTNYHVVKGGPIYKQKEDKSTSNLYVRLSNRRGYMAKIIAADPRADLAVMTIDYDALKMKRDEVVPLKMGSRDKFRKGQIVISLGNPYAQARDGSASASWGMISNISRKPKPAAKVDNFETRKQETLHHLGTLLHVDTRLGIGTSGGALLNLKGELVGITTSMAALEGYETTVGYAVPFNAAMRRVVATLVKGHEVEYGFLGVSPLDVTPNSASPIPRRLKRGFGTRVAQVHENSPAERAGIVANDVILDVDSQPIRDRYDLMRHIGNKPPEAKSRLRIWRSGEGREFFVSVQLGKWPVVNSAEIIATNPRFPVWRGIKVDYPTGRNKYLPRPHRYHKAVLVTSVKNPKLEQGRRLQPGDFITHVNGKPVQTPAEFAKVTKPLRGPAILKLASKREIRVAP